MSRIGKPDEVALTFGTKDTLLSHSEERRLRSPAMAEALTKLSYVSDDPTEAEERSRLFNVLREVGIQNWSAFDSNDGVAFLEHSDFIDRLGLNNWPYKDRG